jgi:hypothetical protein
MRRVVDTWTEGCALARDVDADKEEPTESSCVVEPSELERIVHSAASGTLSREAAQDAVRELMEPTIQMLFGPRGLRGPRNPSDAGTRMSELIHRLCDDNFARLRAFVAAWKGSPQVRLTTWLKVVAKRVILDSQRQVLTDPRIAGRRQRTVAHAWASLSTLPAPCEQPSADTTMCGFVPSARAGACEDDHQAQALGAEIENRLLGSRKIAESRLDRTQLFVCDRLFVRSRGSRLASLHVGLGPSLIATPSTRGVKDQTLGDGFCP